MEPCQAISEQLERLPTSLLNRSGSVFYSGKNAFDRENDLYVLGLNPGASPMMKPEETIGRSIAEWRERDQPWSAYIDDPWLGRPAGSYGLQPRIRHLFENIGRDLRATPSSNLIFARSTTEDMLGSDKRELLTTCWRVHSAVIRQLHVRKVLCFGGTVGHFVRQALQANMLVAEYTETNRRRWKSQAFLSPAGFCVLVLPHPSRTNWCNPSSDPSALVRQMLER